MAFTTKDPNSVGGKRKVAGHATSTIDEHKGDNAPMGEPPTPRMAASYVNKSHAPYDGMRKPAKGSIAGPPSVVMPKLEVTSMAAPPPKLKTTKAD